MMSYYLLAPVTVAGVGVGVYLLVFYDKHKQKLMDTIFALLRHIAMLIGFFTVALLNIHKVQGLDALCYVCAVVGGLCILVEIMYCIFAKLIYRQYHKKHKSDNDSIVG